MRKGWTGLVALAALGSLTTASADSITLVEGDILIMNPVAALGGPSLAEFAGVCEAEGSDLRTFDGIDGLVFTIPEGAADSLATLEVTGENALDVDVYWYDADCGFIEDTTMATEGNDEEGLIPIGATYGAVNLALGAQAHVLLTATPFA